MLPSCIFPAAVVPSPAFSRTEPILIVLLLFFPFSILLSRELVPDLCALEDTEERRDLVDFGWFDGGEVVGAKKEKGFVFVISVRRVSSFDIVAAW